MNDQEREIAMENMFSDFIFPFSEAALSLEGLKRLDKTNVYIGNEELKKMISN